MTTFFMLQHHIIALFLNGGGGLVAAVIWKLFPRGLDKRGRPNFLRVAAHFWKKGKGRRRRLSRTDQTGQVHRFYVILRGFLVIPRVRAFFKHYPSSTRNK
ncbi:MAG: hypothetical protein ACREBS_03090 [Nitrososphaerales archaeon]